MPTKLIVALLAILVLVTLVALPFADLFTEWLWFGEVGYQSVFVKSLATKGILGVLALVGTFTVLFANLRLAVRGPHGPYTVFPGGGDIPPIVLERRHLSRPFHKYANVFLLYSAAEYGTVLYAGWHRNRCRVRAPTGLFCRPPKNGR